MSLLKNSKAINQVKEVTRDDPHLPSLPGNAQCFLLDQPESWQLLCQCRGHQDGIYKYHGDWWSPSTRNLHWIEIMCIFYSSGRSPTDKSKCFSSHRKKHYPHLVRIHPMNISFIFSSTVNELGSLIHTLNKSSQILSASSEAPVEAIGKIIFTVKADWLGINTHDLGLFSTMLYWTKIQN